MVPKAPGGKNRGFEQTKNEENNTRHGALIKTRAVQGKPRASQAGPRTVRAGPGWPKPALGLVLVTGPSDYYVSDYCFTPSIRKTPIIIITEGDY